MLIKPLKICPRTFKITHCCENFPYLVPLNVKRTKKRLKRVLTNFAKKPLESTTTICSNLVSYLQKFILIRSQFFHFKNHFLSLSLCYKLFVFWRTHVSLSKDSSFGLLTEVEENLYKWGFKKMTDKLLHRIIIIRRLQRFVWKINRIYLSKQEETVEGPGGEPWSSGYWRRLMTKTTWVWNLAMDTR